jgi:guanosine-3',5'-bis(diphosphate) 3'-pyrophosphohydrolase
VVYLLKTFKMPAFDDKQIGLIFKALRFAAEKHRGQRRKNAEASPYINHVIEVADLLWDVGGVRDVNLIVAALLHDTLEDTETRPDEIEALFGREVLALVREVTDDESLKSQERKQLQIEHAPHLSLETKQLKLADKISNIRDVGTNPPKDWDLKRRANYLAWAEQVAAGLRGSNPNLERLFDQVLPQGREELKHEAGST